MHMNRNFLDKRKITPHREIARTNLVIQVCVTKGKNVRSLIQGKIHIQQNWDKGAEYL